MKDNNKILHWDDAPDILKIPQVAELLQLGINQTYEIAKGEGFPGIYFGKQIRVHKEALKKWIVDKTPM
jgi:excisionase family DNA binding protein